MSKTIKIGGRIESAEQGGIVTGANAILDDTKGKKQNVINSETDAELERLDNAKQDVLTFDNAPTEGSNNPVKSGGVYAADAALQQAIEAILQLIPSAATALNQLADKAFVNSTVATNTATFRGTYNVVTDLSLHYNSTHQEIATALLSVVQTADNNDYCFVQIPVSDSSGDIRVTERYKFNGTAWSYEYDLNNSGFTADQWAAINSTITLALVQKLGALPTAAELAQQLALKQNTLTFDTAPVAGSSNPVTSGGLYNVIAAINATIPSGASVDNKLVAESRLTQYVAAIVNALDATFNVTSTDGHVNVQLTQVDGAITSVEVITNDIASASALNTLTGRVTTNEGNISLLQAAYNALQQSAPVIIQPTDTWPVANPSATVIYRVIDRENTPPQYYSDYMWNGTAMVFMATYNNAIDDVPTAGSDNLVKSGGVYEEIFQISFKEDMKGSLQKNFHNGLILASTHQPHDAQQWNRYSYFIPIKQGQTFIANVACDDNHYAISFYSSNSFDSFVDGILGSDNAQLKEYAYSANADGYIVICCTEYFIQDYTFANTNYGIQLSVDSLIDENVNAQDKQFVYILNAGESIRLTRDASDGNAIANVVFLDKDGGDLSSVRLAPGSIQDVYLESAVTYIDIRKNSVAQSIHISIKNLSSDAFKLESINENIFQNLVGLFPAKGNLQTYWVNDIISTDGKLQQDIKTWNRISSFLAVKKGCVISCRSACDANHYAIAFYQENNFLSFVGGTKGTNVNSIKDYVYIAPDDGYVLISSCEYYVNNDFSDSDYSIIQNTTYNYWKKEKNLPFTNPELVSVIVDSAELSSDDYRKTNCGLGYDVIWDEQNNRYAMLCAGYNSEIGYAQVGLLFSTDLQNWANQGVVLAPTGIDGDPDKGSITFPQLTKYRDKWIMYYVAFDEAGFEQGVHTICCAESSDLINWERKGIVLTRQDFVTAGVWSNTALENGKGVIYRPRVRNIFGRYYMFINGGPDGDANPNSGTYENVYVAVSDNPTKGWKVLDMVIDAQVMEPTDAYKIASDPDIISNGKDFILAFWSREGIRFAIGDYSTFPLNWELSEYKGMGIRPLFIPTKEELYIIVNYEGATKIVLFKAKWKL